jgi:SulP family sulfate permease
MAGPAGRELGLRQPFAIGASYMNSPRRSHLVDAGERLMANGKPARVEAETCTQGIVADDGSETRSTETATQSPPREPTLSLIKTFSAHTNDPELMAKLAVYFSRVELQAGDVLWRQGDAADGLYVIESGVLQANYDFAAHSAPVQEVRSSLSCLKLRSLWMASSR